MCGPAAQIGSEGDNEMAIKIRCTSCSKKISVDDAFAGGMCRCPYCTETVSVPAKRSRGKGGRPDTSASRPDAPFVEPVAAPAPASATEASTPAAPAAAHHIPVANPVRTQWVLLLILLAVMASAGIVAVIWLARQQERQQPDSGQAEVEVKDVNPFDVAPVSETGKAAIAAIAGMKIRAPVVYCVDNSAGMRKTFDAVSAMTQASIESLGQDRRFALLLCARRDADGNERVWVMPGGYRPGGPDGKAKADGFLEAVDCFGDVDLPGTIAKALELKAKTIVLCGRMKVADPEQLGAKAKAGGATIVTVSITDDDERAASLAALAEASGGDNRRFTIDELESWIQSGN